MSEITKNSRRFVAIFEEQEECIAKGDTPFVRQARKDAIGRFVALGGFPTKKVESYKYTDLNKYFNDEVVFYCCDDSVSSNVEVSKIAPIQDAYVVQSVNGVLSEGKDVALLKQQGVVVCPIRRAMVEYAELFEEYYDKEAKENEHSIVALNTALSNTGVFIHVPKRVELVKPIQLLHEYNAEASSFIAPRNLIIVESGAKADFLDCRYSLKDKMTLSNSVTELFAHQNSLVDYCRVQDFSSKAGGVDSFFINQKRDSKVTTNVISLNAKFIRNNIFVSMDDENCENETYGVYLPREDKHIDNFSIINHKAPNCRSWEHFKGILADSSTSGFSGRIHVWKDAQNTEAYQTNNNLLLSNDAKASSKPQLIIDADDVKCSHGATVGQLDDDAIFYLRARGIGKKEAYRVMMIAFVNEITQKIKLDALREYVEEKVASQLREV